FVLLRPLLSPSAPSPVALQPWTTINVQGCVFQDKWPEQFGQGMPKLLVGSPVSLAREIEAAANAGPINECFLLIPQGLHTRDQIMRSLELFGTKVLPKF
ncbi:MAG: hypothetical protein VX075_14060, partial [Pseudomonadota bacterium]|nr:hypothetical protein [Pseudomonadota bacterium]